MSVEEKELAVLRWGAELVDLVAMRKVVWRGSKRRRSLEKRITSMQWIIRMLGE
jgi:hypothetical protein